MAGNFGGPMVQRAVLAPKNTPTADNTATIDVGPFFNDFASTLLIVLERQSQVGAANTFDAKPMWRMSEGHDWIDFVDGAGNLVAFEQWATTDTGVKQLLMGLFPIGGDVDLVVNVDASAVVQARRYSGILVPTEMIIRLTQTQAVGKSNVYGLSIFGQG